MKRQIILDTETTGLNARSGNRIIEIGCVELINRKLTGNNFHCYINPERDSEEGALAVHGLTTQFLRDKPKFAQIIDEFIKYVHGAEVIIHNAPFDIGFLDAEFDRLGFPLFEDQIEGVVDTLVQAKELHPGKRNSLDALCNRYEISNSHRKLHGALLDAELLAEVFLAMSRGQNSFSIDVAEDKKSPVIVDFPVENQVFDILISSVATDELEAHEVLMLGIEKEIRGKSVWREVAVGPTLE